MVRSGLSSVRLRPRCSEVWFGLRTPEDQMNPLRGLTRHLFSFHPPFFSPLPSPSLRQPSSLTSNISASSLIYSLSSFYYSFHSNQDFLFSFFQQLRVNLHLQNSTFFFVVAKTMLEVKEVKRIFYLHLQLLLTFFSRIHHFISCSLALLLHLSIRPVGSVLEDFRDPVWARAGWLHSSAVSRTFILY